MSTLITELFILAGLLFFFGSIDELFIDLAHLIGGLTPLSIDKDQWKEWMQFPEKPIAVMIPAWKEADVLEAMVKTNLARIQYSNFKWFIGVYPNDPETLSIAKKLEETYFDKIKVIVTDRPGPTSKAHCLNCILNEMEDSCSKAKSSWKPHYIAIHDAEDVIHPYSFTAINAQDGNHDFIQIPVFSLPTPATAWVAGTYLDEFAEIHLKEIPVRQLLKMPIPSAGVGTFFSRKILTKLNSRFGYCFDEANLTEDYEISQRISRLEGKQMFLLVRDQKGEILATREYFPDSLGRSIRQKTRWTTGIGMQTLAKWNRFGPHLSRKYWFRDWMAAYALYRDRKALWANPSAFLGWFLACFFVAASSTEYLERSIVDKDRHFLMILFTLNAFLFGIRVVQRSRFTTSIYGITQGVFSVPRILPSNFINGMASLSAIRGYVSAKQKGFVRPMVWDKTDHKFPKDCDLPEVTDFREGPGLLQGKRATSIVSEIYGNRS